MCKLSEKVAQHLRSCDTKKEVLISNKDNSSEKVAQHLVAKFDDVAEPNCYLCVCKDGTILVPEKYKVVEPALISYIDSSNLSTCPSCGAVGEKVGYDYRYANNACWKVW